MTKRLLYLAKVSQSGFTVSTGANHIASDSGVIIIASKGFI